MGKNMKRLNAYHRLKVTAKQCFERKSTVQQFSVKEEESMYEL